MQPEDPTTSLEPPRDASDLDGALESGLSRNIRSLFDHESSDPGPELEEGDAARSAREARDRFTTNVARYLGAESADRDALTPGIVEDARVLRRSDALRAVADAVVSLALTGEEAGDEAAMELAGELLDANVATHLAVRLGSEREPEAREAIVRVATLLPDRVAPALADALAEAPDRAARRALMDTLCVLGEPGRNAVLGLLDDPHWYTVRNGVALLGDMGDAETVQALTVPLAHDDSRVRRETITALAKIGSEDAGLLIVGMLDDPEPEVRAAAAMGVGVLKVERAHRPLLELLTSDDDEEVQVQVLRALGQLGDPGAVPLIEKRATGSLFSRPPRAVRIAAYRALAAIGTPHARSVLEAATSDRDTEIRQAIEGILRNRSRAQPDEVESPEAEIPAEASADEDVGAVETADGDEPAETESRGSS